MDSPLSTCLWLVDDPVEEVRCLLRFWLAWLLSGVIFSFGMLLFDASMYVSGKRGKQYATKLQGNQNLLPFQMCTGK